MTLGDIVITVFFFTAVVGFLSVYLLRNACRVRVSDITRRRETIFWIAFGLIGVGTVLFALRVATMGGGYLLAVAWWLLFISACGLVYLIDRVIGVIALALWIRSDERTRTTITGEDAEKLQGDLRRWYWLYRIIVAPDRIEQTRETLRRQRSEKLA